MVQIFALFVDGLATAKIRTAKVLNVRTCVISRLRKREN